ncbi:ABC transporter ATP-binding protein [Wenyingzhuangia sp. 2_MG-2023]|uniref:ABC transporter ATP-binding protein n=1 Tax=Wenyingzhuangia sp. 2_MG-2023 TaxID=3062639 RepID=UPI0026E18311|nr:ATP-binding cassette domain-containing protein [Wenyingzhuangia sp. 2_MG-2023]MDO6737429.1 ATP-binding cassette domain-containing protein [Wenyingzhuangia sp. 2_MG-2023]
MIHTEHLTFQYKKKENVFSFPNITLNQQENLLVLGKSGIGKTTLLHLLAGLLKPTNGTVMIDHVVINKLVTKQLDKFRGENIGLVFQKKHAIQSLNVLENLQARLYFSKKKIENTAIETVLKQLDLNEFKHNKVNKLSEGQLQRLSIASAVIHQPKVILADEPTSSLDDENCKIVMKLLIEQAQKTKANLIVITHDSRIKPFFQNTITL